MVRCCCLLALALMTGCSGEVDGAELHDVACSTEYLTVTHHADGSTTTEAEIRAELDTDLDATDLWRVSAVGCELAESPPTPTCAQNQTCAARPTSVCASVFAGIAVAGKLLAICGRRTEHRTAAGMVTSSTTRKYNRVIFRVQ